MTVHKGPLGASHKEMTADDLSASITPYGLMMMMMMINFINVSRPHSLGKSHTNLGTQLIDIKNM